MIKNDNLEGKCEYLIYLINTDDVTTYSTQMDLVHEIYQVGESAQIQLLAILLDRYNAKTIIMNSVDGTIFELLLKSNNPAIKDKLNQYLSNGIVKLISDYDINYLPLQKLLLCKQFQKADMLTQSLLCNLSQKAGHHNRPWLYFTDVRSLPTVDLRTIDQLWQVHSEGLFGLSVQKRIWLSTNSNWERFWTKIGWKVNNVSCRYPQEFIWNMTAPEGHLPLFNQLRGVQVLAALFDHPAFYT
uniref:GUN4-like domain-containing protein n=1 Tax=Helminthocladia australis TaxID=260093 RepID=A0A1G4NTP8_9FLOR|nr:Hypothetical protein ycf53 [Helminthocladia australis]SCW21879.1 Hypothetical protein ycf53 [Helminthocladia australis]